MSDARSSNLVGKLRAERRKWGDEPACQEVPAMCEQAADEIERLQRDLLLAINDRDMYKQQRADWKAVADSRVGVETTTTQWLADARVAWNANCRCGCGACAAFDLKIINALNGEASR